MNGRQSLKAMFLTIMSVSQILSSVLIVFVAYVVGHHPMAAPITTTVVQPVQYLPADHFLPWHDEREFYRGPVAVPFDRGWEVE